MLRKLREIIEEKSVYDTDYGRYIISVSDIEEVLADVREELPVVPQFVANEIERYDNMLDMLSGEYFNSSFEEIDDDGLLIWIDENREIFARAWLDGYTVEKEKLYRVELIRGKYLIYNHKNNQLHNQELDAYVGDYEQREFTEQEIKAIDERYWAFAEEVTE